MKLRTAFLFISLVFGFSLLYLFADRDALPDYLAKAYRHAGVFFVTSITVDDVRLAYSKAKIPINPKKLKVLVVPGHEPDKGGTQFNNYFERDIVVDIANELARLLSSHGYYDVIISRDKTAWNPILEDYFNDNWHDIIEWRESHTEKMVRLINDGRLKSVQAMDRPDAPQDVALRLYGLNKWLNENEVKLALHLHINDYGGRHGSGPGLHSGISVYIPENQYSNSEASKTVGEYIFRRLSSFMPISTLPLEAEGVVEDQELIALGSFNTVDAVSVLIEYGYIYEPVWADEKLRPLAVKETAFLTYLGLKDFLGEKLSSKLPFESALFPYEWKRDIRTVGTKGEDVFLLQRALQLKGYYPPVGESLQNCPVTGYFGDCTKIALTNFQNSNNLEAVGAFGPSTRDLFNEMFKKF